MSVFFSAKLDFTVPLGTTASNMSLLRNPNPNVCSLSLRWYSHGLSPKSALSVSMLVALKSPEKPDKVIRLFEDYGFTKAQISTLHRTCPSIFRAGSEKTILPKLEFLKAKGLSLPKMAKNLALFPSILRSSLDKQIIPAYEYFMSVIDSDKKLNSIVERCPDILMINVEKHFVPNIVVLREIGVPEANIVTLISRAPRGVMVCSDKFNQIVAQVVNMGFNTSTKNFVRAIAVFISISKSTWESKVMAFKRWGWSDEDVSKAFLRYPQYMKMSVDKITAMMDFFVNEMGLRPCDLVQYPSVLKLSLEKRLKPRYFVVRALISKELVKKTFNLCYMYGSAEDKFLQKFVKPYEKIAPELMKLYKDELALSSGSETDGVKKVFLEREL